MPKMIRCNDPYYPHCNTPLCKQEGWTLIFKGNHHGSSHVSVISLRELILLMASDSEGIDVTKMADALRIVEDKLGD